ncbi:diacylglycerol acyltransferase-domain-containing protein [Hyaloraphidium curvatum]|nr:diacylglycerol acyltransferase-domain-containing protein [Hyaloraphidium curvatum]
MHVFAPFTVFPWLFFRSSFLSFYQKIYFLVSHQLAIRFLPFFRNPTLFGYPVGSWWTWLTHSPHWKACLRYLQLSVESESDVAWGDDEELGNRQILCAMFPHGVLSVSHAVAHLSGELARVGNSDRAGKEPARKVITRLATLQSNFFFPGFREILLANGVVPVTREAILAALQPSADPTAPKTCLVVVPGGAAESAFVPTSRRVPASRPSSPDQRPVQLLLSRRRGFVRLALQAGAALVACFSFGELELYSQPSAAWWGPLADRIKAWTGVRPTVGVGWWGIPYLLPDTSHPVVLVMSKPIPLPRIENPTEEEVSHWHGVFTKELRGVYERHRGRFWGYGESRELDLLVEEGVGGLSSPISAAPPPWSEATGVAVANDDRTRDNEREEDPMVAEEF